MTPSSTTLLTVTSNNGFHLRPIAKFVNEVKKFDAKITLIANNKEVSATQVPSILSLSLEKGATFTLKCKGKEAQKASKALSSFFINCAHFLCFSFRQGILGIHASIFPLTLSFIQYSCRRNRYI